MTWVVKGAIVATNKMTVAKRHVKGVYRREAMVLMAPKALCCQEVSWKTTDLETAVTHPQNFIRKMYIIIPHFNSSKKVSVISGIILWITGCIKIVIRYFYLQRPKTAVYICCLLNTLLPLQLFTWKVSINMTRKHDTQCFV